MRLTLALWLSLVAAAHAQEAPRTSSLGWVRLPGAESCPPAQELARSVEERLHRPVFTGAARADLAVEARVEPSPDGFRATFRVADATGALLGERTLEQAGPCQAMIAPLALALALAIDPEAELTPIEPPPPAPPAPPAPVPPAPVPPAPVPPAPRWRLEVSLAVAGAVELAPNVAPGGVGAVFLTPPGFVPLLVIGMVYPWSRAELAGGWVDHLAALGGAGLCPVAVRDRRISFLACAAIEVGGGAVVGTSGAMSIAGGRERLIGQLDASARVHVRLVGPLLATAALSFLVPLRADPWQLAGGPPYWAPLHVAGVLELGLGLDLGL